MSAKGCDVSVGITMDQTSPAPIHAGCNTPRSQPWTGQTINWTVYQARDTVHWKWKPSSSCGVSPHMSSMLADSSTVIQGYPERYVYRDYHGWCNTIKFFRLISKMVGVVDYYLSFLCLHTHPLEQYFCVEYFLGNSSPQYRHTDFSLTRGSHRFKPARSSLLVYSS